MSALAGAAAHATVFVVDDDEAVRKALCRVLQGAGFTVEGHADGAAFLAALRPNARGCVVIDQAMPGMTGVRVLEQMQLRGLRMPAILFTGSGSRSIESRAKRAAAIACLNKPVDGERLIECVRQALGGIEGRAASP